MNSMYKVPYVQTILDSRQFKLELDTDLSEYDEPVLGKRESIITSSSYTVPNSPKRMADSDNRVEPSYDFERAAQGFK